MKACCARAATVPDMTALQNEGVLCQSSYGAGHDGFGEQDWGGSWD